MNTSPAMNGLFETAISYPDFDAQDRLNRLVGLDDHKRRLTKMLSLLVNPQGIKRWAETHHSGADQLVNMILRRPPLIVLEGDVGSGKSELAETIGDAVARQADVDITLLSLSLSSRGQGRVGEMTQLISSAFEYTVSEAKKLKSESGIARGGIILLVDEADALAQSREAAQMHHEDKAGVNAFIRGIDRISNGQLPAAVIMCTNRINALDPAIKRRAADILKFTRPNTEQRFFVLNNTLSQLGFNQPQIDSLVEVTGEISDRPYGFTFSDLTQRLIPAIVLDAYPNQAITPDQALRVAQTIEPTPPFKEQQ
ncbi:ATPase family protein associated with various cellular activities (AAA) [Spongiibacter sp. IMCC21906]|uniref:AAA family ATPase n=1 Tax=Spongiibacter sp. IMCC21906 TaxID=1620392 RepID=UPI00062DEDA5|nr:AAA family ATPase [Spongiibacter sp. IMCC21906]AKH70558.1 ATPase family protein associated with various cellular activities (AAA) [Spongiibacter sp. IMCC21906]